MAVQLELRVLGDLGVVEGGRPVALPPSRKTRALLAYLAVLDRPQRRERLCEMFWDIPDDPRGALRWSLSKIRQLLKPAGDCLESDRNSVRLLQGAIAIDHARLMELCSAGPDSLDTDRLEEAAGLFRGRFLEDLALPRCPDFEAWRVAMADELEVLQLRILRILVDRLRSEPARALPHAHALSNLVPEDEEIASELRRLSDAARQAVSQTRRPAPRDSDVSPPSPGADESAAGPPSPRAEIAQEIRYCTTRDGVKIAYAASGQGVPIIKAANWLSHLQHDWDSPIWRHWIEALSQRNQLIRYDERGNGLSDWNVSDLSFEAMLADLESIVDAAGLQRFVLLGISQGCAISVGYAVRHPERVLGLVLYGGYVKGWRARGDPHEIARRDAMGTLIAEGWGQQEPAFRQLFTTLFIPGATQEQMDWFNELQRRSASPENAYRLHQAFGDIDVSALLGQVSVPTLVMHGRGDGVVPFASGQAFAEGIPGARFVPLESSNHILLAHEEAFARFMEETRQFLAVVEQGPSPPAPGPELESGRQSVTALAIELITPLQTLESPGSDTSGEQIDRLFAELVASVERHQGLVTSAADGCLTAVFGLARPTEDHAYLACRAALAARALIEADAGGIARIRAGLDTGEAVIRRNRPSGEESVQIAGPPPRVAAQLMRSLRRATIAATARARRSAGGYVRMEKMDRSDHPLLDREERIFELISENQALSRWYLRADHGLSPLVGRDTELALMRQAWRRAREGQGQVVVVIADPGVGKSRLTHEFLTLPEVRGFTVLESGALEFDFNVAYQVVKRLLRSVCAIAEGDPPDTVAQALRTKCAALGLDPRFVPALCFVVEQDAGDAEWQGLDAHERQLRVGEAVRALLAAESRVAPVALLVEDLHWMDAESEAVIVRICETITANRLLVIVTCRPEYRGRWLRRGSFHEMRLEALGTGEINAFLDDLLGEDAALSPLKALLAERTDGTPLFIEEAVRALVETGALVGEAGHYRMSRPVDEIVVPETVQSVISARIGRLDRNERQLLQLASLLGRDVSGPLLQAIAPLPHGEMEAGLKRLQELEFLFEVQSFPTVEYTFKHALTQRVAYSTIPGDARVSLHRRTLHAMERLYGEAIQDHVEKLADHAVRGQVHEAAARYLIQAADRATERSAYDKAARFLDSALTAADAMPASAEQLRRSIDIRTRLRPALDAIGHSAKAMERLAEARQLADQLGDGERLLQVLAHQSYLNSSHGRLDTALEAANTLKAHAVAAGAERYACEADIAAAQALLMRAEAREAAERLRPHYDKYVSEWRHDRFGQMGTRSVWYLGHLAQAEATLGNFEVAGRAEQEARAIAEEVQRPIDLYAAAYFGTLVSILRGPSREQVDALAAYKQAPASGAFLSMRPWLLASIGHAEYVIGDRDAACATLELAIDDARTLDIPQFENYARALIACARSESGGRSNDLAGALEAARQSRDPWIEITVLRAIAERSRGAQRIARLAEARDIAERHGFRPELARASLALGRELLSADRDSAIGELKRAADLFGAMGLYVEQSHAMSLAQPRRSRARPQPEEPATT